MATYGFDIKFILIIIIYAIAMVWFILKTVMENSTLKETFICAISIVSFIPFFLELRAHTTPHFKDIDPMIEACYAPLSHSHLLTFLTFLILSLYAMFLLFNKKLDLPPLVITLCISLGLIGIVLISFFTLQVSAHDFSRLFPSWRHKVTFSLMAFPISLLVVYTGTLYSTIKHKAQINREKQFKNKLLNRMNLYLIKAENWPLFSVLLAFPIFIVISILLILFGQEADSMTKVFTDTATWKYSVEVHPPPVDDRHGHYLCTVAARGNPELVKPIAIGTRNGEPIIVNRQLQIANAFEQLIEELSPRAHKFIRSNYDNYGINLSKRIDTEKLSNTMYILMKPLEWFFLLILYLSCIDPENKISGQYQRPKQKTPAC